MKGVVITKAKTKWGKEMEKIPKFKELCVAYLGMFINKVKKEEKM